MAVADNLTTGVSGAGPASMPNGIREAIINGSAQYGIAPPNSTSLLNNTTNNTTIITQPTTYDPVMIFILVIIAIVILVIIFNGFNREQRY